MPTPVMVGKRIKEIDLVGLFPANEGEITQYYGRIGSGKTYAATSDILEKLRRGNVVYANWRIHYEGTDERKSFAYILFGLMWPFKRRYYYFPKENLKYFQFSDTWAQKEAKPEGGFYKDFTDWLSTRTDCDIYGDEGHVMFDSYAGTRMSIDKRTAVLHTRHFNRSIHIVSQRPTAIHVAMRANVNKFYRCEQIWSWGGLVRFKRSEYQDMLGETVDEDEEKVISTKYYWGKKRVFEAYDTKYLRGDMPQSDKVAFEAYNMSYFDKIRLLFRAFRKATPAIEIDKPSSKFPLQLSTARKAGEKAEIVVHSGHESIRNEGGTKVIEQYTRIVVKEIVSSFAEEEQVLPDKTLLKHEPIRRRGKGAAHKKPGAKSKQTRPVRLAAQRTVIEAKRIPDDLSHADSVDLHSAGREH